MNLEKVFNFIKEKKGYDVPKLYELKKNISLSDGEINYDGNVKLSMWSNLSFPSGHHNFSRIISIYGNLEVFDSSVKSLDKLTYVTGDVFLSKTMIESLGNLKYVGGNLEITHNDNLQSLGNLEDVGGDISLTSSPNIESLGNLKTVGGYFYMYGTQIQSFGNLKSVGGNMSLKKSSMSEKYTEEQIRQMVNVKGKITM